MANKYTDRDLLDFNYQQSDEVNLAEQQKATAEQALKNYGPYNFTYGKQADYDKAIDAILNRKKFSYDLNGDALYQQYKDNYINQGKMAMMDTMGQAAAMTGGYGNSYAATVGNQAYQASLQNLNNVIPELYQLALQSYNAEGDRLTNNLNVLGTDRQLALSEYDTKYNADLSRLTSDRDYYADNHNTAYNRDYTNYSDMVNSNNTNYWNEYNAGYQAEQDAITQANWGKEYALNQRQVAASETAAAAADKSAYYESNWMNPDKLDVNTETGTVTYDGKILNDVVGDGNSLSATLHSDAKLQGNFRTVSGDNFDIQVNGTNYRVENKGKVEDNSTINKLNKINASNGDVLTYNGDAYVKYSDRFFKIGATGGLFNLWDKAGYNDLLTALK